MLAFLALMGVIELKLFAWGGELQGSGEKWSKDNLIRTRDVLGVGCGVLDAPFEGNFRKILHHSGQKIARYLLHSPIKSRLI